MSYVGGPEQPRQAEPSSDVVVVPGRARPAPWTSPLGIFVGVLLIAVLTFGASVALLTRVGTIASSDGEVAATTASTRAPATAVPAAVRVTAGPGTAARVGTGEYQVTFTWTLEGARQGDSALLRFSVGSRVVSEQRGALDANVFSSSTGNLTVTTAQQCTPDGWSAEIVSIRNLTPVGELISSAPGVSCP